MRIRMKRIGNKLREARIRRHLSQSQLAEKVNVSVETIYNWENGNTSPKVKKIKELCSTLKIDIDDILDDKKMYLQETQALIDMMEKLLLLTNEKNSKQFFSNYYFIEREERIIFPDDAADDFEKAMYEEIYNDPILLHFYGDNSGRWWKRTKLSENYQSKLQKKVLQNRQSYPYKKIEEFENSVEFIKAKETLEDFYCFWAWISQVLNFMIRELTIKGLELIAIPISNEEYHRYKQYYPKKPAEFLMFILVDRLTEKLYKEGILNKDFDRNKAVEIFKEDIHFDIYLRRWIKGYNYVDKKTYYTGDIIKYHRSKNMLIHRNSNPLMGKEFE
ncbi:helix-turn-helix domain-containing protein [Enterococcus sp. AZ109]|uniref:helix-turn-helix domain-containing protein n=1 Tax=Enterococcus sp. AZ109 TaxID=2774634 RepID=UPI003F1FD5E1